MRGRKRGRRDRTADTEFVYVVGEEPVVEAEPERQPDQPRVLASGPIVDLEGIARSFETPAHTWRERHRTDPRSIAAPRGACRANIT